jgi:hypothetical protein
MKLTRIESGHYRCASDDRIEFHAIPLLWDVYLNGDRRGSFFKLAEAKVWARQHWQPALFSRLFQKDLSTKSPEAIPLRDAALQGDVVAFVALLDKLTEDQLLADWERPEWIRYARRIGLAVAKK